MSEQKISEHLRASMREAAGMVLADLNGDPEGLSTVVAGMTEVELENTLVGLLAVSKWALLDEAGSREVDAHGEGAPAGPALSFFMRAAAPQQPENG